jgi:ABC-type multidrug transport system fused ATPase/permease subunit
VFKALLTRGWFPVLITAIAVVCLALYDDIPYTIAIPVLVAVLLIGLVVVIIGGRRDDLERHAMKIYEMTGYFTRRFMGNSNISIFATIDDLFAMENATIWEWARGCAMCQRIFDSWANSFTNRVESDFRSRRYILFLHTHINELWSINNHYYEFVEQFVEIARKYQVPANVITQYNKFSGEYNAFVQTFRETITELRNIARIQIEAPGIKLAPELKE